MPGKNTAVFGIYSNRAAVDRGVDELKSAGCRSGDISIVPQNAGNEDASSRKDSKSSGSALTALGIPKDEIGNYEERVQNGGLLLHVRCDDSNGVKKVKDILKRTGAEEIVSTGNGAPDAGKMEKTGAKVAGDSQERPRTGVDAGRTQPRGASLDPTDRPGPRNTAIESEGRRMPRRSDVNDRRKPRPRKTA